MTSDGSSGSGKSDSIKGVLTDHLMKGEWVKKVPKSSDVYGGPLSVLRLLL